MLEPDLFQFTKEISHEDAQKCVMAESQKRDMLLASQFICAKCGACCHECKGVLININDIVGISPSLNMTLTEFVNEYCQVERDSVGMPTYYLLLEGSCRFYDVEKNCTIHDVKPLVCRIHPMRLGYPLIQDYKKATMVHSSCSLRLYPDDVMVVPDNIEREIDLKIWTYITSYYIQQYPQFNEKKAKQYYNVGLQIVNNKNIRQLVKDYIIYTYAATLYLTGERRVGGMIIPEYAVETDTEISRKIGASLKHSIK